jgi:glycosyltransferase involved in cell wall biosynthesis
MKFSIIVPHYQGSISDEIFARGMKCLEDQTFKDFEVLVYHDGPAEKPIIIPPSLNSKVKITDQRENDWGHSNRDRGIKKANGEYIIHFNPDNILYPNALEEIYHESVKDYLIETSNGIVIFPILMTGMQTNGRIFWRNKINAGKNRVLFTGMPAIKNNIDCMQLVMKKSLWVANKGWYDKSKDSDSIMYPKFVNQYGARYCSKVLGEHW